MSFENPFAKKIEKSPDTINIGGVEVDRDKLEYQLDLDKKRANLRNQLDDYSLKYEMLNEEFDSLLETSSFDVSNMIRVYGIKRFDDIAGNISPENMKSYIEGREVNKVQEMIDSGLENVINIFKNLISEMKKNPEENTHESITEFLDSTDLASYRFLGLDESLPFSQYSELKDSEWEKINQYVSNIEGEDLEKIQNSNSKEELINNLIEISSNK